jgi:hypothetical protein
MGYDFQPPRGVAREYDRGTVRFHESDVLKRYAVKAVDDWQGRLALSLADEL